MKLRVEYFWILLIFVYLAAVDVFSQGTQLLREPAISDNSIVFVHATIFGKQTETAAKRFVSRVISVENPARISHLMVT